MGLKSFGVPGNTEDPLDTEPVSSFVMIIGCSTIVIPWYIGMKNRKNRISTAPDWDLAEIGPTSRRL